MAFLKRLKYEFTSLTVEPFIFLFAFGRLIDIGSQVTTNLMIWKICELEFNQTSDTCSNLTLAENEEINHDVQREVATIQSGGLYIGNYLHEFFTCVLRSLDSCTYCYFIIPSKSYVIRKHVINFRNF